MSEKKKPGKGGLVQAKPAEQQALTLEQVMAHPVVQQLNQKLEETKQLLQGLPEAIGRAVAEAQRPNKLPQASGPPVAVRPFAPASKIEFHKKGRIVQDGKEIAPEGQTQRDFNEDLGDLASRKGPRKPKEE